MKSSHDPSGSSTSNAEEPLRGLIEEFARTHETKFGEWIANYPVEEGYSATAKRDAIFLIILEFFQWASRGGQLPKISQSLANTPLQTKRVKRKVIQYLLVLVTFIVIFLMLWLEKGNPPMLPFLGTFSSALAVILSQAALLYLGYRYTEKTPNCSQGVAILLMIAAFSIPVLLFNLISAFVQ